MRSDTTLDNHPVVVLWVSELIKVVEINQPFSALVRKMKISKGCKRDFLKPGCDDTIIKMGRYSCRESCRAPYLDDKMEATRDHAKSKKVNYYHYL